MNRFLQKLGVLTLTLSAFLSASAADFEVDGLCYNITDPEAKTVEVTSAESRYTGHVSVPASVTHNSVQYAVTAIGKQAFFFCSALTEITIPNSVTAIGDDAFFNCSGLTSISIPGSVTAIGDGAFFACISMTSVDVDNDNPAYSSRDGVLYNKTQSRLIFCPPGKTGQVIIPDSVTAIGDYAFSNCINLTSISIPGSVTAIGEEAFSYCTGLTAISIPGSVTTIGKGAFHYCANLSSISIPGSVTAIGDETFFYCASLTNIDVANDNPTYSSGEGILYNKTQSRLIFCPPGKTGQIIIPNSVTAIGEGAFYSCYDLTSIIIPNSVTAIGKCAFYWCSGLTSITIPNSVTALDYGIFLWCTGLTSITIPNSVTAIGDYTFSFCSGLPSITIPGSVTAIGENAFSGCSDLTSIISFAVTPPECGSKAFLYVDTQNCALYVPAESREDYGQAAEWNAFTRTENIVYVSAIQLNDTEVSIEEGTNYSLVAEVLPADATNNTLLWESSNEGCVTVDESGLLTARASGTATITVRSYDGNAEATCNVTVAPQSGIEAVEAAANGTVEVFTLTGVKVARTTANLPAGVYLLRQGSTVSKLLIK